MYLNWAYKHEVKVHVLNVKITQVNFWTGSNYHRYALHCLQGDINGNISFEQITSLVFLATAHLTETTCPLLRGNI